MKKTLKIALLGLIIILYSCSHKQQKADATGIFEAKEIIVSAQITGKIINLNIEQGSNCKQGQQVGIIDTTELSLQKHFLIASLSSTENRKLNSDMQLATLRQKLTNQQKELQRFEKLLTDNAVAQKQVDDIKNNISITKKQIAQQKEQLENNNSSIDNNVNAIGYQIAQIQEKIKNARIICPINGIVLSKYAEQGEFATIGKPIMKIADTENMILRAYVTSDIMQKINMGQQIKVYTDNGKNQDEYKGKIIWISPQAEFTPKTIQTKDERANLVYAIKISVKNNGKIKIGQYGEIKL